VNDLTPHDTFFCAAFADPRHAASLIRSALCRDPSHAALIPHIAWDQMRRVDATVVDAADRSFRVDLLFEAPLVTADGTVIPILFTPIFEHKSFLDRLTAWQSLRYQVRTIDGQRDQPGRHNSWPIVITIVVEKWFHNKSASEAEQRRPRARSEFVAESVDSAENSRRRHRASGPAAAAEVLGNDFGHGSVPWTAPRDMRELFLLPTATVWIERIGAR